MVIVRWPDKTTSAAPTFESLFAGLLAEQWNDYSPTGFRRELKRRCRVWSGVDIDKRGTFAEFFNELQRAELLEIVDDRSEPEFDETGRGGGHAG